jgi:replicative DNA helicase
MITPHDDETELHLLAELAQSQDSLLPEFAVKLTEEHFFCFHKRTIWRELKADFLAGRQASNVTMRDRLVVGAAGQTYHELLVDVFSILRNATGNLGACREAWNVLEKHRKLRKAMEAADNIKLSIEGRDIEAVQQHTEALVHGLNNTQEQHGKSVKEVALEILDEESERDKERGIPFSCLPWLSRKLGGLQRGSLIVLAGPRGSGKSALAAQILWHAVQHHRDKDGKSACKSSYHSHEMTRKTVVQRLMCLEGVRSSYWSTGLQNPTDQKALSRFIGGREIDRESLVVYDSLTRIEEVIAQMRLDVMRRGMRVAAVDLIQRVKGDRSQGREQELSGIAWELKSAAMSLGITVIAMSHLNKQLTARGSEDIENHADQMVIIGVGDADETEPGRDAERRRVLLKITKNRGGEPDVRCIHEFIGPHYKFVEIEETDEDIQPRHDYGQSNGRRRYNDE